MDPAQLAAQITALNSAYSATGFQFSLASAETVTNPAWYNLSVYTPASVEMRATLRKGTLAALNVYATRLNNGGEATPAPKSALHVTGSCRAYVPTVLPSS